jgi:hypothetical protein
MSIDDQDLSNFKRKVSQYQEILANTEKYREKWKKELRNETLNFLEKAATEAGLSCSVEHRADITNLEAVVLSLGSSNSGLGEPVGDGMHRDLIKQNGSLVYQQLFNGKVLVLINYPFIEKYGQPQPPKTLAIYRPEELKSAYFMRHLETFVTEMINWEDYDDDQPEPNQRIGFKLNFEQENAVPD